MSKVATVLHEKAATLRVEADMLKNSISWDLTKQAALNHLVENGVPESDASTILDSLESQALPDKDEVLEKIASIEAEAEVFDSVATYIEDIECKLDSSNARVAELEKQASQSPIAETLKSKGHFSDEEIQELKSLPEGLLNKVASLGEDAPAGLGTVSNRRDTGIDPLTAFLCN